MLTEIWYKIYIMELGLWASVFALANPTLHAPYHLSCAEGGYCHSPCVPRITSINNTTWAYQVTKQEKKNYFLSSSVNTTQEIFWEQPDH